jgi:hypothetical protein
VSFVDKLGTFSKNLALAPLAPARFILEAASAPFRDEEEYNGFINTIKTAGTLAGKQAIAPVLDVFEGIETVAKPGRQALSQVGLVLEQSQGQPANLFKKETWDKAQQYKDEISVGQSLYAPFIDPAGQVLKSVATIAEVFGVENTDRFLPQYLRKDFDIFNESQREQAYKKSLYGRVVSGTGDIAAQILVDPTLVGTKALAPVRAAKVLGSINNGQDAYKAIQGITKAQSGEVNKFTSVLDEFAKNDTTYALNHPLLSGSSNKSLIASLLGQSKTADETGLVLRSALADPVALQTLRDTRFELAQQIDVSLGKLRPFQTDAIMGKTYEDGMLMFPSDNLDEVAELRKELDDLIKRDRTFAKMMDLAETPGGNLVRTTGSKPAQIFDSFLARGRAAKFYDKKTGTPDVDIYQPSPLSRMYQKVSWLENERPSGVLDFNDSDSYREVIATLDRAKVLAPNLFDDVRVRRFVEAYSGAVSPAERQQITLAMEETIWRSIYTKYDIPEAVATNIYNAYQRARKGAVQSIQDKGYMIDLDGSMIHVPQLQSQTADWLPIMDFDLADKLLKRHASTFKLFGKISPAQLAQDGLHGLEVVNDLFKAGALIRLGYTIRNGVDNQLRIMSAVGAEASFQYLGQGAKNIGYNMVQRGLRTVDNVKITAGVKPKVKVVEVKKGFDKARISVVKLTKELDDVQKRLARDPQNPELLGKLSIYTNELEAQKAVRDSLSQSLTKFESTAQAKVSKKSVGQSTFEVTTPMGETYEVDEIFGGTYGDLFKQLTSAESTWNRLADSTSTLFEDRFISKGIGAVKPEDANYFEAWARTLNTQFVGDPVIRRLAAGEDPASIVKWLDSGDGRQYRKDLSIKQYESQQHVDKLKSFLNRYVPNEELRRALLVDNVKVTPAILRETFKEAEVLPVIHGDTIEENLKNVSAKKIDSIINFAMKWLGSVPEDVFARHPLVNSLYRDDLRNRVMNFEELNKRRLTTDELWKAQQAARRTSIASMKKIVFNIDRRTNLGHFMRLIAPFFSAQENAYKTWLRLVKEKPYLINRANVIWNAPNRSGLVTDEEGNPVDPDTLTRDGVIWLEVPQSLKSAPFIGKGLGTLTDVGISKRSLDVVFGGDFNVPLGPYVAIGVGQFVKRVPSAEKVLGWATPFGPPENTLDALAPTWVKRQLVKAQGEASPEYARTYQLIWLTEQHKARDNGTGPIPESKIKELTDNFYNMRTIANLVLPFSPRFASPYRFYMDQYREYQREFGREADEKFLKDYGPEFFDFATSLSSNTTGVQASISAAENIKQNKDLIAEVFSDEPALVGLIVNNPTGYDFSEAAYQYQYNTRIAPGSSETFRGTVDPAEAQRRNNARLGWIQYRQAMDVLDAELQKRGLSSYSNKAAYDLKYTKDQITAKLAVNPDGTPSDWWIDFLDVDGSKTLRVINGLEKILSDEKFVSRNKDNVTWKSIAEYINVRNVIADELAKRTSSSIDANSNYDLKYTYENIIQKMKQDDIGFGDVYDRFLSQDKLYYKYVTKAAG